MNILLEETGRLKITLECEEMKRFDITYEQMDYSNDKTRRVLWTLLKSAGSMTGFDAEKGRLLIEVFPAPEDGCVIYYTRLDSQGEPARLKLRRADCRPFIYRFTDSDSMLRAMEQLAPYGAQLQESYLYETDGSYRLVLYPEDMRCEWMREVLGEFGQELANNRVAEAYVKEHGQQLAGPKAVETVGYSLKAKRA